MKSNISLKNSVWQRNFLRMYICTQRTTFAFYFTRFVTRTEHARLVSNNKNSRFLDKVSLTFQQTSFQRESTWLHAHSGYSGLHERIPFAISPAIINIPRLMNYVKRSCSSVSAAARHKILDRTSNVALPVFNWTFQLHISLWPRSLMCLREAWLKVLRLKNIRLADIPSGAGVKTGASEFRCLLGNARITRQQLFRYHERRRVSLIYLLANAAPFSKRLVKMPSLSTAANGRRCFIFVNDKNWADDRRKVWSIHLNLKLLIKSRLENFQSLTSGK